MPISHIMAFLLATVIATLLIVAVVWLAWRDERGGHYD